MIWIIYVKLMFENAWNEMKLRKTKMKWKNENAFIQPHTPLIVLGALQYYNSLSIEKIILSNTIRANNNKKINQKNS